MDFTEFNLNSDLMKGLEKAGYTACTPVQEQVLKNALNGTDLYVQSQTGTGKTAAYLVPIIQELTAAAENKGKKALILVPTRELAAQVEQEADLLLSCTALKAASFYGGVGYSRQTAAIKQNIDIIVGTPGRVIDLQKSGTLDLSEVSFLVIDEADRMFDMGFYPDLRTLIKVLPQPEKRQTMLFSATLNTYVKNLAWEYTLEAKEITIEADNVTVDEIDQTLLHVSSDNKMKLLVGIMQNEKPESVIIFCNTKRSCEVVSKRLVINGIKSEFIIGDLPQSKRLQVLNSFKRGELACLVATDVAARGIDVSDLAMVINYDLPNEPENYVHRIGRTARAGKTGKAYTFCSEQDVYNLPPIERYIGGSIPSEMAEESLFADDKSDGMYIHTEVFSDRREDRTHRERSGNRERTARGNGKERRFSKQNRIDGTKTRDSIRAATGAGEFARSDKDTKRQPRRNAKEDKRRQKNPSAAIGINAAELSALSFEERMKLYKEKYASAASSASAPNTETAKRAANTAAHSDSGGKNRKSAAAKNARNTPRNGKNAAKSVRHDGERQKAAAGSRQRRPQEQKGVQSFGLLGKIRSLFKRNS
ncbi:MAG: DEAD/DEAH box helicase [Bacteroides sp.]|nr:DEAD/DEAH box helicase [Prevotella sp.]MCM1408243.1 DEAD/DEAH box helicase [Treponema brennaborense]MCM1469567.1 DEAD/DEAH box helicase [Bacteroides sp.]